MYSLEERLCCRPLLREPSFSSAGPQPFTPSRLYDRSSASFPLVRDAIPLFQAHVSSSMILQTMTQSPARLDSVSARVILLRKLARVDRAVWGWWIKGDRGSLGFLSSPTHPQLLQFPQQHLPLTPPTSSQPPSTCSPRPTPPCPPSRRPRLSTRRAPRRSQYVVVI